MIEEVISTLESYYLTACDGDWEHTNGISINTIDNPGWIVEIDLRKPLATPKEQLLKDIERSPSDWIRCSIEDDKFKGVGGPANLAEIINTFTVWASSEN